MTPDYIKQFREEYKKAYKGIFSDEVLEKGNEWYESFLTEVYEKGRRDERESKEPLGICENCDTDNHSDCLGCKCHADY